MYAPTFAPTEYPYGQIERHTMMIVAESISLFNRLLIGAICFRRLWLYRRHGVMYWSEIKTRFHVVMLMTIPFFSPFFVFCLVHYEEWQCFISTDRAMYETWARLYAFYRIGLILQLYCISLMVLTWSRFLHCTEEFRPGVAASRRLEEHLRLKRWLIILNVLNLIGSLAINMTSIITPDQDQGVEGHEEDASYSLMFVMNWIFLDLVQLCLALFLVSRGRAMLQRIRDTGVLETRHQASVVGKVNFCLSLVVGCLLVEVVTRILITIPVLMKDFGDRRPQPTYAIVRFLEENPLLWQFCGYIFPYDVVSFCLLYLMRSPPKRKPSTFSVDLGDDDAQTEEIAAPLVDANYSQFSSESDQQSIFDNQTVTSWSSVTISVKETEEDSDVSQSGPVSTLLDFSSDHDFAQGK